jgi:hypothetical protein
MCTVAEVFVVWIVLLCQLRRMRSVGYVAIWRGTGIRAGFWWGNLNEGDHLKDLGIDGRIILTRF